MPRSARAKISQVPARAGRSASPRVLLVGTAALVAGLPTTVAAR